MQPNSLLSPAAIRNFQRVIDEMKGVDSGHQENDVCIEDEKSSFLLLSSSLEAVSIPEVDVSDVSPPPPAMDRTLGALEDEFVDLLRQRAREEEADMLQLRALAARLGRIVKGRQHLAALIKDRSDKQ